MACNFIKKYTPTQEFSCQFCESLKNTFFEEHLRWILLQRIMILTSSL